MRLIDADELIKELKSLSIVLNGKQIFSDDAKDTVLRIIDEQPTAYDIDKVVEELEERENEAILKAPNTSDITNPEYQKWMMKSYGFKEAIEIVKQGGVSDDVCEWKLEDDNLMTGCGDYFNLYDNCTDKFKHCPRCGKKIKVVE